MVQAQAVEKLHAACDECRTRKLKCSGDGPKCVRCAREGIQCVYSPQKQMGRPRKRRREGEADEPAEASSDGQIDTAISLNELPLNSHFTDVGLTSPPESHDHLSSNGSTKDPMTPCHFDIGAVRAFEVSPIPNADFGMDPLIDPSLWNLLPATSLLNAVEYASPDQSSTGSCTCLSVMYLTLTELQSITTFAFPQIIIPLRKAMNTLSDLIQCPECPKESFNAIQNVQSVFALTKAIIERFNKALYEIDTEAARLEQTGQKKSFRMGDNNPSLFHLHTGTLDCPMGFNIDLEARDWRKIVKGALKTEVYGGGSNQRPLKDLIKEAEARQLRWHSEKDCWPDGRRRLFSHQEHESHKSGRCEALGAHRLQWSIDNLDWN